MSWLALVTITAAFHRMYRRMRRSMSPSPGNSGWSSRGMVLTYGVVTGPGTPGVLDDLVERLLPLMSLDWVDVGKLVYELDADRFAKIARHEARLVHGGCHRTGRRSCDRSHGMTISRKRGPASNWGTCPVSSIITSSQSDLRRHTHSTAGGGTRLSDSP